MFYGKHCLKFYVYNQNIDNILDALRILLTENIFVVNIYKAEFYLHGFLILVAMFIYIFKYLAFVNGMRVLLGMTILKYLILKC